MLLVFRTVRALFFTVASFTLTLLLSSAAAVTLTPEEQAIADKMVNSSDQHRPFMVLDPILTQVARARAADMANRGYFDHVNPDGYGPNYLVEQAGYKLPDWWGDSESANYIESIAAGRDTADATWEDWMNSPPHRDMLLANTSFDVASTSYGVGYAAKSGSPYTYYWVVIAAPPQPTPALSVTSPTEAQRVAAPQVTVSGTAGGAQAAASVVYRVENSAGVGAFVAASGTANFSGVATGLIPGTNTIRIRSLTSTGAVLAERTRHVVYVVLKPLTVNLEGSGTVTAGFAGTSDRELGRRYTILATPAAGFLFSGWSGGATNPARTLTFTMSEGLTLTASFVPNPFLTRATGYSSLLSGDAAGMVKVSLTSTGAFTGSLRYDNRAYTFVGRFSPTGSVTVRIARAGLSPLTLTMQLDAIGNAGITGTITDADRSSTFTAAPNYDGKTIAFAGLGRYTFVLPPGNSESAPQGFGYAVATVDRLGRLTISGALADGATVLTTAHFSANNTASVFLPLYRSKGSLSGIISLTPDAQDDLSGSLHWFKPVLPTARIAPEGLSAELQLRGQTYSAPAAGLSAMALNTLADNAVLALTAPDLGSISQTVTLDSAKRARIDFPTVPSLTLTVTSSNGRFNGSFRNPISGALTTLRGVLLQKSDAGYGFFLESAATGSATLTPQSSPVTN